MPDYNQKLAMLKAKREQTAEASNVAPVSKNDPAADIDKMYNDVINPKPVDKMAKQYDNSYVDDVRNKGVNDAESAKRMKQEEEIGLGYMDYRDTVISPDAWSPDAINANFIQQSGKSLMNGIGKTIGGFGDAAQYLGSYIPGLDLREGNFISNLLQDVGTEISEANKRYIPEEMLNPEFTWQTFMNPDFWSIHVAEAVPQIAEMILLKGAGKGATTAINKVSQKLLKETIQEGAEATAKMGLRATTQGVFAGAKGTVEVGKGRGLWGKMLTDKGTLTRNFGGMTENVISGSLMNLRVSMANAAEVYNTYKDVKDPNGEAMFSEQELGQMASQAFTNNLQYLAVDMLSWGMTFGGGWEKLGSLASKGTKFVSPAAQAKITGGMFTKQVAPIYKNLAKWGGKAVAEGFEETIQESFEEWSKFRAYKDVAGTWKGYEGVTQDYDGFWDYYQSKDSESLRAIAFGAGAAIGGGFNIKQLVNNSADESYKMMNRQESLKTMAKNKESRAWQDHHIRSQMAELVFEGKEAHFEGFLKNLADNNVIDETQLDNYTTLFEEMSAVKGDIADLNISGKKALMVNIANQMDIQNKIELEKAKSEKIQAVLTNQLQTEPDQLKVEIDKEIKRRDTQLMYLSKILADFNSNKTNLLTGKKGKKVGFKTVIDENGTEIIIPDNEAETTDNSDKNTEAKTAPEFSLRNLGQKAKDIFNSLIGKTGDTDTTQQQAAPGTVAPDGTLQTDGAIDMLTDPTEFAMQSQVGDIIDVDGQQATITSINENIDTGGGRSIDSIDYELNSDSKLDYTTDEEIKSRQKTARLTKNNTFFDDRTNTVLNVSKAKPKAPVAKSSIVDNDAQTEINDEVFKTFVNTGNIPSGVINSIADKISNDIPLTKEEVSVMGEYGSEIEAILQDKLKIQDEIINDDDLTDAEKAFLKKQATRQTSSKTKTLDDNNQEFLDNLKNQKVPTKKKKGNIFDDADTDDDSGRKKVTVEEVKTKGLGLLQKAKKFLVDVKQKASDVATDFDNEVNLGNIADMDSITLGQQVAVNEKLREMFPNNLVYTLAVNNLSKVLGFPSIGYTISGAIFIDKTKWKQDNVFMHEMSHIYFNLFESEPETQATLAYFMKNEALVNKVLKDYNDELLYKDNKGNVYKKRSLIGTKAFQNMVKNDGSPMTVDEKFKAMEEFVGLKELPIEEQTVIKEEVFALGLEGDLAETYNKYFDPKDEVVRQHYAKKWWGKIKDRADKAFGKSSDIAFLKTLTTDEQIEYTNKKDYIISKFKETINGKEITGPGRSKLEDANNEKYLNDISEIEKKLSIENELYLGVKVKDAEAVIKEAAESDALIESMDEDPQNWYENDRLKYGEKASQYIRDFAKLYEKNLRRKFYMANKNKPTNWSNIPVFDKDKLQVALINMAQNSPSNLDFIYQIENSNIEEIQDFNFYMTEVRPDKNMALSSMYFIYNNQSKLNSVITKINEDGSISVENNLNEKELSMVDNVVDQLLKKGGSFFNANKNKQTEEEFDNNAIAFNMLTDAVDRIKSGDYTMYDVYNLLLPFSTPNMDLASIVKGNIINVNGKNFTLDTVVSNFVNKTFPTVSGTYLDYNLYDKGQFKPEIRKFIKSLVATNRRYNADFTVYNAVGNQEPVLVINNFVTRELKSMEKDAKELGRNQFLKKYSNLSKLNPKGSLSNQMLNYFYDEVQEGNKLEVSLFSGVQNNLNKNSNVIRDSNSTEMSITEFAMYLGDLRKGSYLMETGRFSDSPTSYLLKAPKVKIMDLGRFINGKFVFSNKAKGSFENIYSAYQGFDGEMTIKEFQDYIINEIDNEIDFFQKNISSLKNISNFDAFHNNGVLNNGGKEIISEYVINTIYNGINFSDIFFPSFKSKDLLKRAKSGRSPGFSFGENVELEAIPFIDPSNDSGAYILPIHAEMVQRAGGNIMPLNNSYKLLHTGVEHNNEAFAGRNIFNKGYFTVLDDEAIRISPSLKGLRDLMQKRLDKYEAANGPVSKNILRGDKTQFIYAFPTSSDKASMVPVKLVDKDENATLEGNNFTLENINKNTEAVEQYLDKWYYPDNTFLGLQGGNFVVQQVMDKQKTTSNFAIQAFRSILTNAGINGNLEVAEDIQRKITGQIVKNFEKFEKILESDDVNEIREFLLSNMLLDDVDPTQKFLLLNDKLDITLPAVKQIAQNTIANIIRRNSNKFETPGSVLQAKAPTYEKPYGYTNGSKELAFYTQNSDGSHNKGEAVLPAFMAGNLRPRKSFLFKANQTTNISDVDYQNSQIEKAKNIAKSEGKKTGMIKDENGNDVGIYIEGDTIIATRIPAHGPQSTGVFEVIELSGQASNIMLPNEFSRVITGGDFDGDAFFVNHKGPRLPLWNDAFDQLTNLWLSKEMAAEVVMPLNFEQEAKDAVKFVETMYDMETTPAMVFSPRGKREAFNNSLITKNSIGTTANLHSIVGMLAAYETDLVTPITINGKKATKFVDSTNESRTINSAKIFNIIMDNVKHHFADKLGINEHTDAHTIILRNLGFSLEEIGVVLNHPIVKRINELQSESQNIYGDNYNAREIEQLIRKDKNFQIGFSKNKTINVSFDNINSPENNLAVLNLMNQLGVINADVMKISGMLQGHNNLETNPFNMSKIKNEFNETVNNINNKGIKVPPRFASNPLVQQYYRTFEINEKIQGKFDPVYARRITDTFGNITESMARNLNKYDTKKIYSDFDAFFTSRMLGFNNIPKAKYESLVDLKNEDNVFQQLKNEIAQMSTLHLVDIMTGVKSKTTQFDNNLLFKKGLRYKTSGKNQFISMNISFFNNTANVEERARMMDEFANLPKKLQNDLMLYDLMRTGWTGKDSLFHLFPLELKKELSQASRNVVANAQVNSNVLADLKNAIIQQNNNMLLKAEGYPFKFVNGEASLSTEFMRENPAIMRNILKGQETYFKITTPKNEQKIIHFKGWPQSSFSGMNSDDYKASIPSLAYKNMNTIDINNAPHKTQVVSIPDTNITNDIGDVLKEASENDDDDGGRSKREEAADYYNYTELMSIEQYATVTGLNKNVSDVRKQVLYDAYKKDFAKAMADSLTINANTVGKMTSEELVELYSSKKLKTTGEPGYAHRNKFAYARVMRPIIMEIAKRAGMEQAELITKNGNTSSGYEGKDIGYFESYLMANNIPSNQPEIQSLVRTMEVEFIKFKKEKNKYMTKLSAATDALYREQLGYAVSNAGVIDKIKNILGNLFENKVDIYKKLYGPLIMFEEIVDGNTGQTITNMKYKPLEQIESEYKGGTISKAQYEFYKVTTELTNELKPFALTEGKQGRADYIPHTAPAWLEIKARRGMLGLAVASKTVDERIYDVNLKIKDPFTGKEVVTNFGNIETMYNQLSKTEQRGFDKAMEFSKIKQRAIALARKGINEDGSALQISNVEIGSAMGDVFMTRFSSSRSIASTDLPSWDLNKAFADYTHSTLFNNGNENFSGMNKMLPLVDGILALTDSRKDKNANKYVNKVWREYFLSGSKQSSFSNNSYLEAVGLSTDKVIDYLTKASLIYWLGWKGLVIGGGAYAIGNVLVGKYMNIKNAGLGTWAKGEKRFWTGGKGFNILNPFEGIQKSVRILKNAQFMDINVYDDVALDQKESLGNMFTNIALLPMIWSEKWIQGVDFLGRLTDEEYETLANQGTIDPAKMAKYENQVKNNHGKGYQATDQRMIQMYSWGRNMLQFSRYIPTVFYDQFAKEDLNIYGNKHIGSYTVVGKHIQKVITGEVKPKDFMAHRRGLDTYERNRLDQALIGFGMLALFAGTSIGGIESNGLFEDANPLMDADKMLSKTTPPSVAMLQNIF
jgi:hypothetical protein